jgi:4-hydroxybenzoate polyprenyltransferase
VLLLLFLIGILNAIFYSAPPIRFKGVPILDSISSSLHFVFPALIGVFITNHFYDSLHVLFAFFLWGIASHIIGAIPDIQYDKKAKISTVATFLGKRFAVIIAVFFYCFSGILLMLGSVPMIFILLLLPYCFNAASFLMDKRFLKLKPFRYFMYYNLFYGFVSTIYIIWRYIV